MNYTALARKWRPRIFSQLIGQEPIKIALINSLEQDRLHHAYLFSGTRGVGKTSIARLFAKSLNCEQGVSASPCLECSNCLSIEQGRFIDLIEVDGASKTRVEDTRELLENIQYVPTIGRFKIYLIDEVHMLSQHSFNALLKTLEEPPLHVKFLLATTDPQKLPITVLSRCLQFNLKPLDQETIVHHLQMILEAEHVDYELEGLNLIARAAHGSVRDALSLLDQAIAVCSNKLLTPQIKQLLGYSQQDYALQLIQALAKQNPHDILAINKKIAAEGGPFQHVLDELLHYFHQISIYHAVQNNSEFVFNSPDIQALSNQFSPEDIQLLYQIGIKNKEDIHLAPSPAIAFDMMLLRMYTFRPDISDNMGVLTQIHSKFVPVELPPYMPPENTAIIPVEDAFQPHDNIKNVSEESKQQLTSIENHQSEWAKLLLQLNLTGLALSAAENAEFIEKNQQQVIFRIEKGHESVFTTTVIKRLEQALTNHYQEPIKITLQIVETQASTLAIAKRITQENQHQYAEAVIQGDPFFQQLQQDFSGELIKTSIESNKDSL